MSRTQASININFSELSGYCIYHLL